MRTWIQGAAALALGSALWAGGQAAHAGAVITYGNTSLGVNDAGELNFWGNGPGGSLVYGVYRDGVGDAISPGCPCEGWGVLVNSSGGSFATWANQSSGSGGIGIGNTFGATGSTATSTVNMAGIGVSVRQAYGPSLAADVFLNQVTITNNTGARLDNVVYRRAMDWDVPPTPFSEYVTHVGVTANLTTNGGNVLYASNNGFATTDPRVSAGVTGDYGSESVNTDFTRLGPSDHGSAFDFSFGPLEAGASRIFNIYYGSAANEAEAVSKLASLGANVYSLGQPNVANPGDAATFLFGFGGVGGVEVGSTEDVPVLPFTPAPGEFVFDAPLPRRWFDPPFADGFDIALEGATFISVTAPSKFFNMVLIAEDGTVLDDDFDAGETFYFGAGVSGFKIRGLSIDTATTDLASALPLFLDFTPGATKMTWTVSMAAAVPEPSTYALALVGMLAVAVARRRRVH